MINKPLKALKRLDVYLDMINDSKKAFSLDKLAKLLALKEISADYLDHSYFDKEEYISFLRNSIYECDSLETSFFFSKRCFEDIQLEYNNSIFQQTCQNALFIYSKRPERFELLSYQLKTANPLCLFESKYFPTVHTQISQRIEEITFCQSLRMREALVFCTEMQSLPLNLHLSLLFKETFTRFLLETKQIVFTEAFELLDYFNFYLKFQDLLLVSDKLRLKRLFESAFKLVDLSVLRYDQLVRVLRETHLLPEVETALKTKFNEFQCFLPELCDLVEFLLEKRICSKFLIFFLSNQCVGVFKRGMSSSQFSKEFSVVFAFICENESKFEFSNGILEFFEEFKNFVYKSKFTDSTSVEPENMIFIQKYFMKVDKYRDLSFSKYLEESVNLVNRLNVIV